MVESPEADAAPGSPGFTGTLKVVAVSEGERFPSLDSARSGLPADGDLILIVEDNDRDARFVEVMLVEGFGSSVTLGRARSQSEALATLDDREAVCVLVDLGLADNDGVEIVGLLRRRSPNAAIVVLTGDENADTAVAAVAAGAQDYLLKSRWDADTLRRVVRCAIVRRRTERGLAEATTRLAAIVESCPEPIISVTLDAVITSWNAGAERLFGYAASEMIGRSAETPRPPRSET